MTHATREGSMVSQPFETEVKLSASSSVGAALREMRLLQGEWTTATLVTTYFDTERRRLHEQGVSLRIRQMGSASEQTLKRILPDEATIRRVEWTIATAQGRPDVSLFPKRARALVSRLRKDEPLEAVAVTRIERATCQVRHRASLVAVAIDGGAIEAGSRAWPIQEVELELIEGQPSDLFHLALELPLGADLMWSTCSKADQAFALADDTAPRMARISSPVLRQEGDVASGFRAIVWNCLNHVLANYPMVASQGDPHALHRCRVAIRRLHTALSIFGKLVDDLEAREFRAELKAVATGLGRARDLEVMLARLRLAAAAMEMEAGDLLDHVCELRIAAMRDAGRLLTGEPFQRLLFRLALWLECGEWLRAEDGAVARRRFKPVAAAILSERRRALLKKARDFLHLSSQERHQVRIAAKKMRYASDFLASLWPGDKAEQWQRQFSKALTRLQNDLGDLNDLNVAAASQGTLFADLDAITAARLEADLHALLAAQAPSAKKLLKRANASLDRIESLPIWWQA